MGSKPNTRVTIEAVDIVLRIAWEKLTRNDIAEVFGQVKALQWFTGETNLVRLWNFATRAERERLVEAMNDYLDDQPASTPRSKLIGR